MKEESDINDIDIKELVQNYLIFIKEIDEIKELIDDLKTFPSWNSLAQVVIIYLNEINDDDLIPETMQELRAHYMNVNIIGFKNNTVHCYTIFPYGGANCDNKEDIQPELIDECQFSVDDQYETENYVLNVTEILSAKTADKFPSGLHGCPIIAASRPWEPFTYYDENDHLYAGIDLMIMKTLSDIMNVTSNIYLDNRTLYHVFQSVIEKEIHLVIGGVDEDPSLSQLISTSIPYHQDDLTWCLAVADRDVHWTSFLQFIDGLTWALIAVSILSLSLGLFYCGDLLKERKGLFKIISAILASLINQSPDINSKRISLRMIGILIFIFSLVINNAYQSFLISFLTHPSQKHQISTIEELYRNSYHISGGLETLRHLTKEDEVTSYLRKKLFVCNNVESCLKSASHHASILAVAASREHVFYNPRIPREKLYCFPTNRNIYSFYISFITSTQSHLIDRINDILQQIIESGHIIKWTRDIDNERTLKDEMKERELVSDVRLNMGQLKGPFMFSTILIMISVLVFLFELTIYKKAENERKSGKKGFWYKFHLKVYRL